MQPLKENSGGNAPVFLLLLDRLQGQFLLQQKVLIFFYKMMFAQKVNLLFSYFVAVTVCRDQSRMVAFPGIPGTGTSIPTPCEVLLIASDRR